MLIQYLHSAPISGAIWIVILLLELLTLLAIRHSGFHRTHGAFALYVSFCVVKTIVLMAVPPGKNFAIYTWLSAPASTVQCLLIAVCIADLYRRTLDSAISLPAWVPRHFGALLAIAVGLSAGLSVSFSPQYGSRSYRILMGTQQGAVLILAFALWILILYGIRIGHRLTPGAAEIAIGFVLMLSTNAVSLLVGLTAATNISRPALRAGQFFTILAFGWWSWRLWRETPIPERASPEATARMREMCGETVSAVQRIPGEKVK